MAAFTGTRARGPIPQEGEHQQLGKSTFQLQFPLSTLQLLECLAASLVATSPDRGVIVPKGLGGVIGSQAQEDQVRHKVYSALAANILDSERCELHPCSSTPVLEGPF